MPLSRPAMPQRWMSPSSPTSRRVSMWWSGAPPPLLALLLGNGGVLVGQALFLTGGNVTATFALPLLSSLVTSGRFGTYWLMRVIVVLLTVGLWLYQWQFKQRPQRVNTVLSWANLLLGLALFIDMALSGHAAAVSPDKVAYAAILDWLHLVAAALWVGSMMYIATCYLPVLHRSVLTER